MNIDTLNQLFNNINNKIMDPKFQFLLCASTSAVVTGIEYSAVRFSNILNTNEALFCSGASLLIGIEMSSLLALRTYIKNKNDEKENLGVLRKSN